MFQKGNIPWDKGKKRPPFSEDHKRKISQVLKGRKLSEEIRKKRFGRKGTYGFLGKKHTEEWQQKMREKMKGNQYSKGRKVSEETRQKLSKAHKGTKKPWSIPPHYTKENHPSWRGGISFEPYSVDWTEGLRRSIRERDHYICQLCRKLQGDIAHDVHHVDYNKRNCNPDNLITLCHSCNAKVNNNRNYWTNYFKSKCQR